MAVVKDWIDGFLHRHRGRFKPGDWPDPGSSEMAEFAEMWRSAFVRGGVSESEADEGSKLCGERPANYRREHLPLVMAAIRASRERRGTVTAETRESAWGLSKGCEHCGGEGLATVWHPRPGWATENRIPRHIAATCVCPLGRWMRRRHAQCSPDLLRRIPDLADVLEGRSSWEAEQPDASIVGAKEGAMY